MSYDYAGRIYQDNVAFHMAQYRANERHHQEALREQRAMLGLMQYQNQLDILERQAAQKSNKRRQKEQQKTALFQSIMENGMGFLKKEAYPAAIDEFTRARKEFYTDYVMKIVKSAAYSFNLNKVPYANAVTQRWEELSVDYYYNLGMAYYLNKDYMNAIFNFDELIKKDPNNYALYNLRARARFQHNRRTQQFFFSDIERDFDTSLAKKDYQDIIKALRAFVREEYEEAIALFEKLLSTDETSLTDQIELSELLGDAYYATEKKNAALEAYGRALSILPDKSKYNEQVEILRTKRGDIFLGLNQEEEALFEYRKAHEKNKENPLCFFQEAKKGDTEKQFLIAIARYKGTPAIKRNWSIALELFESCAAKKNAAYSFLGEIYSYGRVDIQKDLSKAAHFYQQSDNGDIRYKAGLLFLSGGEGLPANPQQAIECFRYAAEHAAEPLNKINAAFQLGKFLAVEHSYAEACKYFRMVADSAEKELPAAKKNEAAYTIGLWYLEGREGVPKNLCAGFAYKYLKQAHNAEYVPAREPFAKVNFEIGETYSHAEKETVLTNYTIAAKLGHGMAAFRAGELYRLGAPGIPKDNEKAKEYLKMAVDLGVDTAKASYDEANSFCCIL